MRRAARLALLLAIGGAAGAGALWLGSDGLRAFTAESARRLEVERRPRALPEVALQDQDGHPASLRDLAGKVVLLDFIYARCPTVCTVQGSGFEVLRERIRAGGLEGRIALVTLSFDPAHDGPAELADYAGRYGGADAVWRFLRAPSEEDTRALLRAAAVKAIPDGGGGFVHNAAIHVIDRSGRLVRILDSDAADQAMALALALL